MLSGYSRDADGKVEVSTGSRMPLRHQLGLSPVRETESAPPQPRAIYQRPLKTVSAPTIGEEPEEMFRLPSNSFFPSNPWPDKEVEGKQSPEPFSRIATFIKKCSAGKFVPKPSLHLA